MTLALIIALQLSVAQAQSGLEWATEAPAPPAAGPTVTTPARPAVAVVPQTGPLSLPPALQSQFDQAVRAEKVEDWPKAATLYDGVLAGQSKYTPAVMGLGRAREKAGDLEGAILAYGLLPLDPQAIESRAFLMERTSPVQAAALYQELQRLRPDEAFPHLGEARAMLRVDSVAAAKCVDRYLKLVQQDPSAGVILDVVGALRERNEDEQAEVLLARFLQRWDHTEEAPEFRARLDRIRVERAAQDLRIGGAEPLSAELHERVEEARELAGQGELAAALSELQAVVQAAPRSAEAWAAIGDIHSLQGHMGEAEQAFAWAAALEPDEATWHVRLGVLLANAYGGKRDRDARDQFKTALARRPSWSELHYHLGRVQQALREFDGALVAYQAYLEAEPNGPWALAAAEQVEALSRKAPPPLEPLVGGARPSDVPAEALQAYKTARVYRDDHDDSVKARAELARALELAPDWVAAVNMEAAIELSEGDEEGAIAVWRRSLEIDPAQARVRLTIGEILRRRGEQSAAIEVLDRAAADGAADAYYILADMAFEAHNYLEAEAALESYFSASTGGLSHDPAQALQQRVQTRLMQINAALAGAVLLILGAVAGFVIRRRTGAPLTTLVHAAPEAAHDVVRVASTIRHELLKHNTSLLGEMATALQHGDDHAVAWGANRLFGGPEQPGVVERFKGYVKSLERLGRRHGVRLDLRRKDPVFAPMHAAMGTLSGLEKELRRPARRKGARARAAQELRILDRSLNDEGYQGLGLLLQEMGTLSLDAEHLRRVDARVRAEPAMSGVQLPALDLQVLAGPVDIRIFPGDLDDIAANLLRNAYQAVAGEPSGRVGISVVEALDPITGIGHIELRFRDTAPGDLTDTTLHGQQIGRGLGLTVDLVLRHDGTIHVEPEPGWSKAIVVALRKVDRPPLVSVAEEIA